MSKGCVVCMAWCQDNDTLVLLLYSERKAQPLRECAYLALDFPFSVVFAEAVWCYDLEDFTEHVLMGENAWERSRSRSDGEGQVGHWRIREIEGLRCIDGRQW